MHFRLRDILLSGSGLLLLSPLLGFICLLLWLTQERVFFCQRRPGRDERPFTLLKFSTMRDIRAGEDEYANQQARLTPAGRYLRKWSLDELPQLVNVLRGEMSLVGPRPLLMAYLPLYTEQERQRHSVLPGITGWAQVHGRNGLPFKQRFELDVWYVQHRSFGLDLRIMGMTLVRVLQRGGVYSDASTTSPPFDGTN